MRAVPARRASRSLVRLGDRARAERQHREQRHPPDQHIEHDAGEPVHRHPLTPAAHARRPAAASAAACRAPGAARLVAASVSAASSRRSGAGRSAIASRNFGRRCASGSGSSGSNRPGRADARRAAQPPGLVHREARDRDAVEQHAPPRGHHAAPQRHQPVAVQHQPADRGAVHHLGARRARGSACRRPPSGSAWPRPRCASAGMGRQVAPFAMHRAPRSAASPADTAGAARRAPGGRRRGPGGRASVISRTPRRTRLSCTVPIARSLPGMTRRGEHHRVALAQCDARMGVHGDAGQRAARLALAAGDQDQQVVVRDVVDVVLAQERRDAGEIAAFARRGLQVAQRAADQRDAAPGIAARRARWIPRARRWRRSRSPRRARAGRGSARRGFARTSASLPEWPSTMALVESQTIASTPSLAQRRERGLVGRRADQRVGIELPVAGVQHARRAACVIDQRLRFRDRMRHADEAQR